MLSKMFTVGLYFTNCYVVWCSQTREAIIVDPGFNRKEEAKKVLGFLNENKLKAKLIVDTHGHPDHTSGNNTVKQATGAHILIHELDANMLKKLETPQALLFSFHSTQEAPASTADGYLKEGDTVKIGKSELKVLHTPGHSPGSISLVGEKCVFTGDTLFAGSIGRVDLPGGSSKKIMHSLRTKLAVLPNNLVVYPGHGPSSTIGREKQNNPFLQESFDTSFLE